MDDFTQRFPNYDNEELLRIIENADRYQPTAVAAAQKVLALREPSAAEIEGVKEK